MDPTSKFFSRILNVPPDADKDTITKAYRKMALKYHPDRAGVYSKLKFQHVGVAYEILMAKSSTKGKARGAEKYAGKNLRSQQRKYNKQKKRDRSFKFSFESDSSSTMEDIWFIEGVSCLLWPLHRARVCCSTTIGAVGFCGTAMFGPNSTCFYIYTANADSAATVDVEFTSSQY